MPHIHDLIDFTVDVFIVNNQRVLLIFHKKHNMWLQIGGHIELNEDPDEDLDTDLIIYLQARLNLDVAQDLLAQESSHISIGGLPNNLTSAACLYWL